MQAQSNSLTAEQWAERAKGLLEEALAEFDRDVIPEVTEALACLYLSMGENAETVALGTADLAERVAEPEVECICPPELVAAGGFKGNCPARGILHG